MLEVIEPISREQRKNILLKLIGATFVIDLHNSFQISETI